MPLARAIMDAVAPAPDEATRWQQSVRDYAACHPTWVATRGGRALHAIMDGDTIPLCGVQPQPPGRAHAWRRTSRLHSARRHRQCELLAGRETTRRLQALFQRQREEFERGV